MIWQLIKVSHIQCKEVQLELILVSLVNQVNPVNPVSQANLASSLLTMVVTETMEITKATTTEEITMVTTTVQPLSEH